MSELSKMEEAVQRKNELTQELAQMQADSLKSFKAIEEKETQLQIIQDEIDKLRNPNNSILKIFSRVSEKAGSVVRNVRLSIMSEDDLKKEYEIYKRVNETLGKEVINFDTFKETPEDFIEKKLKKTKFRNFEESVLSATSSFDNAINDVVQTSERGVSKASQALNDVVNNSEKRIIKASQVVDDVVQKSAPAIISFANMISQSFSRVGKQAQEMINNTVERYEQAEREVNKESDLDLTDKKPIQAKDKASVQRSQENKNKVLVEEYADLYNKAHQNLVKKNTDKASIQRSKENKNKVLVEEYADLYNEVNQIPVETNTSNKTNTDKQSVQPSEENKIKIFVTEYVDLSNESNQAPVKNGEAKGIVKRTPAKKTVGRKEILKNEAQKEKIKGCKLALKKYVKVIDKSTPSGSSPSYNFDDYKNYVEQTEVPKNFQLNKVSFTKSIKMIEKSNIFSVKPIVTVPVKDDIQKVKKSTI